VPVVCKIKGLGLLAINGQIEGLIFDLETMNELWYRTAGKSYNTTNWTAKRSSATRWARPFIDV